MKTELLPSDQLEGMTWPLSHIVGRANSPLNMFLRGGAISVKRKVAKGIHIFHFHFIISISVVATHNH